MATLEQFVRFHGASFREGITKFYLNHGDEAGEALCRRWVWEILDHATEVHGPTVAQDMLRSALEAIQIDMPPEIAEPAGTADPFEEILKQANGTLGAQIQAFEHLADGVVALGARVDEYRKAQERKPTRADIAWRVFDRLMWWPLWLFAGFVLASIVR